MKSSILRAGVALACALGLAACGGGSGDLPLTGSVIGVNKDGLVLQNNGGHDTAVAAPYTAFQFNDNVSTDDEFNVTVKSMPSNIESCTVDYGKARANYYTIAQIRVVCSVKLHALQVAVSGLKNSGLVLVNGSDRQEVPAGATKQLMAKVPEDAPYGVAILTQPANQTCTVANGSGTMGATDLIDKVVVTCN
jgi:hypothetical protein